MIRLRPRSRAVLGPVVGLALGLALGPAGALGGRALSAADSVPGADATRVLDTRSLTGMGGLLDAVADRRVIFVGESHDRYEDHLNQLAVIEGLKRRGKDLAIGMEFFQQPYQGALDAYVDGAIDEAELLRRSQYFDRWRFDYRLYRPILRYAREQGIPVIALNLESELTRRVGEVGIEGLDRAERARLPSQIDRTDPAYRKRLEEVFAMHPGADRRSFDRFMEVQLLWDEGMAERAARYLRENPQKTLVVLAGAGHIEQGQGIPRRLQRRVPVSMATLLPAVEGAPDPARADFLLYPQRVDLPPGGLLGVQLGEPGTGRGVPVQGFGQDSGAKAAGLKDGDRIVRVAESPVASYADIRVALLDRGPGERLPVEVVRPRAHGGDERLTFEVELR